MEIKYKWYEKFWVNWLILTVIYLISFFLAANGHITQPGSFVFFVGLFVPFGLWNSLSLIAVTSLWGLLPLPLFAVCLFFVDKLAIKLKIRIGKILLNLFILLMLTLVIDLIIWGRPCSWLLFSQGSNPTNCGSLNIT